MRTPLATSELTAYVDLDSGHRPRPESNICRFQSGSKRCSVLFPGTSGISKNSAINLSYGLFYIKLQLVRIGVQANSRAEIQDGGLNSNIPKSL